MAILINGVRLEYDDLVAVVMEQERRVLLFGPMAMGKSTLAAQSKRLCH